MFMHSRFPAQFSLGRAGGMLENVAEGIGSVAASQHGDAYPSAATKED
jgi:hypothetical protein